MNGGGTGWWLNQVGRIPLLTPAQEIALGSRVQTWMGHEDGPDGAPPGIRRSGRKARDQFVAANLRLAVSYVTKHCGRLIRLGYQDDLVQAANLGVIRAVEKFDPQRGYRFSTYAYWWIRQSVNRWVDANTRMVSIPGSHSQLLTKIETSRRRLSAELLREPTREELASEVELSVEALEELLLRARSHLSLDQSADEDGGDLGLFVGSEDPDVGDAEERALLAARLAELMQCLTPQQVRIVRLRYGLEGPPVPASEVAKVERVSSRQVERLLREATAAMSLARRGLGHRPTPFPSNVRSYEQLTLFPAPGGRPKPTRGGAPRLARRRRGAPVDTPTLPLDGRVDRGDGPSSGSPSRADRRSRAGSEGPSRGTTRDGSPSGTPPPD